MNWNHWIRQIHRWLSIAFTLTVIANFVAIAQAGGAMPPPWITYSPLLPLALLMFTWPVPVRAAVYRQVAQRATPTKGMKMKSQPQAAGTAASQLISDKITELADWRGKTLARLRALIREADPEVLEEVKWMGTPVWSHDGGICTGETYKSVVKLTFFKGASLKDPARLFNSSLDGNVRRAIDIHEGEAIDTTAFKALIRAAVALNTSGGKKSTKR